MRLRRSGTEAGMVFQRHFWSESCNPSTAAGPDQVYGCVHVCESEVGKEGGGGSAEGEGMCVDSHTVQPAG